MEVKSVETEFLRCILSYGRRSSRSGLSTISRGNAGEGKFRGPPSISLSLSHSLPPSLSFPWLNSEIAGQIIGLQSWVRLEAERVVGRVGKELSTSRVVAGQTLLVGAANISLTPWQTNLTFVRASPLCRLPLLFTLRLPFPYWRDWLFLSYKTARCFPKFPTFSSSSSSSRVPL